MPDPQPRTSSSPGSGPPRVRPPVPHFHRSVERPFLESECQRVKILYGGGLSRRADRLIRAALEGLGYQVELLPVPAKADFQTGREYCNNGQCNPSYFLAGTLVSHLKRLRDEEGVATEKILSDYVFLTAGSCGPCRFGMYEAEFRLALRNAGFDGFRVLVAQQAGAGEGRALRLDADLVPAVLYATVIADLLNEVAFYVRPYEIEPGRTDEVVDKCLVLCEEALRDRPENRSSPASEAGKLLRHLRSTRFTDVLARCRKILDEEVEVDSTRLKPIVKVTGEFWAQTTEGDGNFRMFSFLEGEGAEVLIEPVSTFLGFLLREELNRVVDRKGQKRPWAGWETLRQDFELPAWRLGRRLRRAFQYRWKAMVLTLVDKLLVREYERLRRALGGTAHPLVDQRLLERLAHPFYNSRACGGEGHLEVAKNIYYQHLSHMVLSLKPFGCMPSTQSDGVQAAVVSRYPDILFLPVETSGEGDVNAYSRVQMALGEAKARCKAELEACLARLPYTLGEIRAYVEEHRELRRPLRKLPHPEGVVGQAARFVLHVASLIEKDPAWKARPKLEGEPAP